MILVFVIAGLVAYQAQKDNSSNNKQKKPKKTQNQNFDKLSRMKNTSYTPKAADLSPEGFNWVHREFAVIFSQSAYQHNWKGHIKQAKLNSNLDNLNSYINSLQTITVQQFKKWPKVYQLPFLINAYHAFLLKQMINQDFKNLDDTLLNKPNTVLIFSKKYSLNEFIKNEILKQTNDPRVAFSLKCFAKGCPEFRNTIFNYKNIDNMLKTCTTRYMSDPDNQNYNTSKKTFTFAKPISKFKSLFNKDQQVQSKYLSTFIKNNKVISSAMDSGVKIIFE